MAKPIADKPQKSNVTPETILEHARYMRKAKVILDEASSDYRGCRKRAKAAGVDLAAMAMCEALANMDEDEAILRMRHVGYYGKLLGMSFATQPDMFGDDDAPRPSAKAAEEHALFEAEDEGRTVGYSGNSESTNPHAPGSALNQAWALGWRHGKESFDRKTEASGEDVKAPRGRKRKAGNPEDRPAQ